MAIGRSVLGVYYVGPLTAAVLSTTASIWFLALLHRIRPASAPQLFWRQLRYLGIADLLYAVSTLVIGSWPHGGTKER